MELSAEEWKNKGNDMYKKGDYRGAIEMYTQAIDLEPTTAAYYGNRSAAYLMLLKYKEAISDSSRATVIEPSFIKGYARKAKAQLALGEVEIAIKTCQAGLLKDPKDSALINEKRQAEIIVDKLKRGKEYLATNRFSEALYCFEGASQVCPGSNIVRKLKAESLMGSEKYDEAFAVLTQLMRADASSPEILYLRSKCLYFQGEFASAIKHLQQALRSDPDNSIYMKEIKRIRSLDSQKEEANTFFKNGQYEQAVEAYSNCLSIDPQNKSYNAKLHCNRAAAYSKLNKNEHAIKDCDTALYYDNSYTKAHIRKAQCLRDLGGKENLEQALREYEMASKLVNEDTQRQYSVYIRETKLALKKAKRKDYYKILNVSANATEHEIKKAYKRMALQYHPDRHANKSEEDQKAAELSFKDIGEAYAVLSDAEKKRRYDSGVDIEDLDNEFAGAGGMGGASGVDPSQIFQMFFGGGGMGGGGMGGMGGHSHGGGGGQNGNVRFHFG